MTSLEMRKETADYSGYLFMCRKKCKIEGKTPLETTETERKSERQTNQQTETERPFSPVANLFFSLFVKKIFIYNYFIFLIIH